MIHGKVFLQGSWRQESEAIALKHVEKAKELEITKVKFLKHDVYLLIEGIKKD